MYIAFTSSYVFLKDCFVPTITECSIYIRQHYLKNRKNGDCDVNTCRTSFCIRSSKNINKHKLKF